MTSSNMGSKLNSVQLHLLELFSKDMSENDLLEIKELLVKYYKDKVENEVESFWKKKNFTKETWNKATRDQHLRGKNSSNK